jgi:hypothetical protein
MFVKMLLFQHTHSHDIYHQDSDIVKENSIYDNIKQFCREKEKILEQVGDLSAD